MSEEILKALMQLFAIIAKQDVGLSTNERKYVHTFLKQQLNESAVKEYLALFDKHIGGQKSKNNDPSAKPKLTSVRDSVKTLGIAKKINKTLTQQQKVVVIVRLFELINSDKKFTKQRIAIIDTAADVFNISKEEYKSIEGFVIKENVSEIDDGNIMIVNSDNTKINEACKKLEHELDGNLFILKISSVDLYFLRYDGNDELLLNGLPINNKSIYLLANGSVIKPPKGKPILYSDVASKFLADTSFTQINFEAEKLGYVFPNGNIGLRDIAVSETSGKMVAIMGASGAGKTTLLNVLSGMDAPTKGNVTINNVDVHHNPGKVKGIVGYIPQDDLLIEELTVYNNLYYNAKLVFRDLTDEEIDQRVNKVLNNLGLIHIKHLKVGNPLNKKISGGQRKRLNIGLELIREPAILFVDEPTSGLSSKDSENVMELLREITLKGKLIFVVIHQPSSDIYKMFDNVIVLDTGGYQVYYGNPVEGVIYFKQLDNQINSDVGECPRCGNVNPETVFSIIEARIVDEYGRATDKRKKSPEEWNEAFIKNYIPQAHEQYNSQTEKQNEQENKEEEITKNIKQPGKKEVENNKEEANALPETTRIPTWFKQLKIYFKRDLFSKLANTQYITLSLLEAPLIGFLLAFVIRYIDDPNSSNYIFRENDNVMPYIFMLTIVAIFLGLIVSAEEIFKDRKILKREAFLNLSRSSYLFAKIGILILLSAIQAFLFMIVGNSIMGIKGMLFDYWLAFFSLSVMANVLGLNISSAFNSAVTIYILIPFLIIPQMVLTGAMFSFDKINKHIGGGKEKVPIIAEVMPTRWAFEALVVDQFKSNKYEQHFYELEKKERNFNYKNVTYLPELKGFIEKYLVKVSTDTAKQPISKDDLELLRNEISKEMENVRSIKYKYLDKLNKKDFNRNIADSTLAYFERLQDYYKIRYNYINEKRDAKIRAMQDTPEKKEQFQELYDDYYNEYLASFVKNSMAPLRLVRLDNRFVRKIDPIYLDPQDKNIYSFRTHFLAPRKNFFGSFVDTFTFNIVVIWLFTALLYISLYYELLSKLLLSFDKLKGSIKLPRVKLNLFKKTGKIFPFKKKKKKKKTNKK